ncbi:DnaB-like helicase N terminal domain-containing protein [Actinacidiphila rubida]|uniref:DnaB-like helicase N terminal domain-containing protein n=2 Tax=Actinacidiphila rubida TaxID=310780 RepID=A0A1H8S3X1_9ACTN|nr:DnaB-like helicase N-terminal domain-containing protein [Actinacidiphila rubida]SEO73345.1 DnaB-like helicase N terminal domain-containing protein [Actinacidiphila rubida]
MTTHDTADLDERGEPEPPGALHYAEQALLGALLLDPEQLAGVPDLRSDHFANPSHSALFAAMRTLTPPDPDAHRASPVWLTAVLKTAATTALGLDAPYIHTLINACPRPEHAPVYAQMIRAEHVRRALREHAMQMEQLADDSTLPEPATVVLEQADALGRFLDRAEPQWPRQSGPVPRAAPAPANEVLAEEDLDAERLLLAAGTAHPEDLARMGWLHPEDFRLPLHRDLYRCLTAMTRHGDPIDPITVLWNAQQHAALHGTDPARVLDFLHQAAGSAEHWAEHLYIRALLTTARTAGHEITALTDDPAHAPHHLIPAARRALAPLARIRARRRAPPTTATAPVAAPRPPALAASTPQHATR